MRPKRPRPPLVAGAKCTRFRDNRRFVHNATVISGKPAYRILAMQPIAGAGAADDAKAAATAALKAAAKQLRPAAMRRAIRAGADLGGVEGGIFREFEYDLPRPVSWVLHSDSLDEAAAAIVEGRRRSRSGRQRCGCFTSMAALTLHTQPA